MENIFNIAEINLSSFSRKEKYLFESYILVCLQDKLLEKFKSHYQKHLEFIKNEIMEDAMETNFLHYIIKDILSDSRSTFFIFSIFFIQRLINGNRADIFLSELFNKQ